MNQDIIELFKTSYRNMMQTDLSRLDQLYSEDVVFKDPIHQIRGLASMQDYLAEMCSNLNECQFEFLDQLQSEDTAYIKWNMNFSHPKLAAGKLISVRGISQLHFDEKISFHEDVYDMGAMLYEQLPVMGPLTCWLKRRLVS